MSVLIKHMAMPKGCMYANDKDQTEYCPLLNHDDVPFCQHIENEPEAAIGIDERPVYCPLFDVSESCQDTVSRAAAIDAIGAILPVEPMKNEYTQGITCGAALAIGYVKQLPSAQPEIVRCKDCEYWQDQQEGVIEEPICARPENQYEKHPFRLFIGEDGFCSFGERRNDAED